MRSRTVAILLILVFGTLSPVLEAGSRQRWHTCLNQSDCRKLAKKLNDPFDSAMAALFAEYLRPDGEPVDMGVVGEASRISQPAENSTGALLLQMIFGDNESARDLAGSLSAGLKKDVPARILHALSYIDDSRAFDKYAGQILKEESVPYLAYKLAGYALEGGRCDDAMEYLGPYVGRYKENPDFVSLWAASNMDCNRYGRDLHKGLSSAYKKEPEAHHVLAQLIRYLRGKQGSLNKMNSPSPRPVPYGTGPRPSPPLDRLGALQRGEGKKEIEGLISNIDIGALKGKGGSILLAEWAAYEIDRANFAHAEALLERSVSLDPKNAPAHKALGKLYLRDGNRLPKAVASLKNYAQISRNNRDTDGLKIVIRDLEREIGGMR